MTAQSVLIDMIDGLAHVKLNRPDVLNSFDETMAAQFRDVMHMIASQKKARAVIISGAGRGFCAGGDIAAFGSDESSIAAVGRLISNLHEGVNILANLPVPTLALVHGAVAGAGFSLSLSCDFVIAADNAKFTLAYSKLGATPDGGSSWMLPRLVGIRKALEIAMLSDVMSAQEALNLGLINRIVPSANIDEEGLAFARRLSMSATQALGRAKRLIHGSYDLSLSGQLDEEKKAFLASLATQDFAEGKAAFQAKRPPQFVGR